MILPMSFPVPAIVLQKIACIIVILAVATGCNLNSKKPLIAKNEKSERERNNHLIVFVGEKISFQNIPNEDGFEAAFYAHYKVLQRVYGEYTPDTIAFTLYDHYGVPSFSNDQHVLLFVVEVKGKYYLEKYQAITVYPTKDGQWAGIYHPADYAGNKDVVPQRMEFARPVVVPVSSRKFYDDDVNVNFPAPYFTIRKDSATALYGNYVRELFRL